MGAMGTFNLYAQTINQVQDDLVLLCCEPSLHIGGFVAASFTVHSNGTETSTLYWAIPVYANGKFTLQPRTKCSWCGRVLPAIESKVKRSSVN
jgi:hypothetical protein